MRSKLLAAIAAFVVAVTGFGAAIHGHLPAVDGWHAAAAGGATGASSDDEGLGSCSLCRLAHETSSAPVALGVVSVPLSRVAMRTDECCAVTHSSPVADHSPRAPPCPASC